MLNVKVTVSLIVCMKMVKMIKLSPNVMMVCGLMIMNVSNVVGMLLCVLKMMVKLKNVQMICMLWTVNVLNLVIML